MPVDEAISDKEEIDDDEIKKSNVVGHNWDLLSFCSQSHADFSPHYFCKSSYNKSDWNGISTC